MVVATTTFSRTTYKFIFEGFNLAESNVNVEDGIGGNFGIFQRRSIRVDAGIVQDATARVDPLGPDVAESVAHSSSTTTYPKKNFKLINFNSFNLKLNDLNVPSRGTGTTSSLSTSKSVAVSSSIVEGVGLFL